MKKPALLPQLFVLILAILPLLSACSTKSKVSEVVPMQDYTGDLKLSPAS